MKCTKNGIYFNNVTNTLVNTESGRRVPIGRDEGHPFLPWNRDPDCQLTTTQLHKLQRCFGHPYAKTLAKILSRTEFDDAPARTRTTLHQIKQECRSHRTYPHVPDVLSSSNKATLTSRIAFSPTLFISGVNRLSMLLMKLHIIKPPVSFRLFLLMSFGELSTSAG